MTGTIKTQMRAYGIRVLLSRHAEIRKLKRDGKNFSNKSLEQLLLVINKNNIVKLRMHPVAINNVQVLRDIVKSMDDKDVQNVPAAFREKFPQSNIDASL